MQRIAVLTSGGDAPGMNAAIRAVVRSARVRGWDVLGVRPGPRGPPAAAPQPRAARAVGGVLQRGGTTLGSARCEEFLSDEGPRRAVEILSRRAVDGVVVIGGNGSQSGSCALARAGAAVVGVASTIDNDLVGSDITIGTDTALNVALEAIDRLKVTASALGRAFLVEVMGRNCGYLALMAGIAGGAEAIVLPEVATTPEDVAAAVQAAYSRRQAHAIVVVAEGARWNAEKLAAWFHERRAELGFELRATILGHVQRGGAPGAFDRLLATRFGVAAVERLAAGEHGVLVGHLEGRTAFTPLDQVAGRTRPLDTALLDLARTLAT